MSDEKPPDLGSYFDQFIEAGIKDPADLAVKVQGAAPPELIEAHALHFLKLAARERMSRRRHVNEVIHGVTARARQVTGRPAIGRPVGGSTKRAGQREQFAADRARWLSDTIWTGERRIALGEATVTDLFAAAESMRVQAARSVATATRYTEIAEVVKAEGVATVGDLPPARLQALMDRE